MTPDADLVRRCLAGDRTAWAALLERYADLVHGLLWRAGLDEASRADAFQEVSVLLWKNLRRAIQAGLPRQAALQALTINAARIYGVDKQMGTIEPGKIADLVVMTGDFADSKSKVKYLFIDKSKFDPENEPAARPALPVPSPMEDE